jgi:hypothetical protein
VGIAFTVSTCPGAVFGLISDPNMRGRVIRNLNNLLRGLTLAWVLGVEAVVEVFLGNQPSRSKLGHVLKTLLCNLEDLVNKGSFAAYVARMLHGSVFYQRF